MDSVAKALDSNINGTDSTAILFCLSASPPGYFDGIAIHAVLGRLAERSASLQDREHLLDAAWSLSHFGHTHVPLLRALRDSTLGSADVLSVDDIARLVVIFQRASLSRHALSIMDPDLAPGNAYLQQLARLAETKLSSIADLLTLSRVVEAVRVVLYPNPAAQPSVGGKVDARSLAESSFSPSPDGGAARPAFDANVGDEPILSQAATQGMTEDGFNAYTYNEIEGIHRDSDRLAALVAAAAKGKSTPVEPGIVLSNAELALVPLGALVRLKFALQHLPLHTVSATSMSAIDVEISTRCKQRKAFDASRSTLSDENSLFEVDALDREETAMLTRMWLSTPATRARGLKLASSRVHRTISSKINNVSSEEIQHCSDLIDTLRALTEAGRYCEDVLSSAAEVQSAHPVLATSTFPSPDSQQGSVPLGRMERELCFQSGVLHEVLHTYKMMKHT